MKLNWLGWEDEVYTRHHRRRRAWRKWKELPALGDAVVTDLKFTLCVSENEYDGRVREGLVNVPVTVSVRGCVGVCVYV